ncbi:MAG: Caspase domain-containing protein [Aphanocapsa sp. GSE-SYN-MK-11-07L]|jgi:hypothetical protein|nr:Caspase domain-containing protein [Aphanocapsa sp. GSE-SYN-MK-11-07L]
MLKRSLLCFLLCSTASLTVLFVRELQAHQDREQANLVHSCRTEQPQSFLAFGGGGAASYNEIALEKNMLYFQRTLQAMRYNPTVAPIFFANGNSGQATVRYLDPQGEEKFKVPQIPNLQGASTPANLRRSLQQLTQYPGIPIFFYFTGHGHFNQNNTDNNGIYLWGDQQMSVQQLSRLLDRLPSETPFVTMMSQCYSGSFANLIYKGGDPKQGIALQTRCGFFATIKTEPSVGCTPEVNEADYQDYSSSFYAGLSGRDRLGQSVASADYNQDGRVAYAEAHAFAKVEEQTTDLPISTSEAWLQRQSSPQFQEQILVQPIANLLKTARPEQRHVIERLSAKFSFRLGQSLAENLSPIDEQKLDEVEQAYLTRLAVELENVGLEQQVRQSGNQSAIAILDRLLKCEADSWGRP